MIWSDNCGVHKADLVDDLSELLVVEISCSPPNMTGTSQVLDFVVNGPLKALTRILKGVRIVECFQIFKELYDAEFRKEEDERMIIRFVPPKPDMIQGI